MSKSRLILMFLMVAMYAVNVIAQEYTIKGKITDMYNQPLPAVMVSNQQNVLNYTDEHGNFSFESQRGINKIYIKYLGMQDSVVTVNVTNSDINLGNIRLKELGTILKEVSVNTTSMPYKSGIQGTNYYVNPLTMKRVQPISTEEMLKALPGVNVLSDMGISNRLNVSIRGSWNRRSEKILIMEDGAPISPAPYTAPGVYYNPISDRISGIEVLTGADLLRYGPNNMFGMINYNTPKPPQRPALKAKITGGQRGYFTGLMSYGGTWDRVGAQIEGVFKKFDGFTDNSSVQMINLNAKVYAQLADNQSLFFKVSGQFEDNQATLSSMTPYTFSVDPTKHPFDADRFTMHRYGMDIIHKYTPDDNSSFTSRIFASDFARDWWRQASTVIKAADVRQYVGEDIFSEKYKYLEGKSFTDEDYVRVGKINSKGRESTTDSRWNFTVASFDETYEHTFKGDGWKNNIEVQAKLYKETYIDRVLASDSTKWARTGRFTTDLQYSLYSISGYLRNQFTYGNLDIIPIFRLENVHMFRTDNIANANNPNLTSDEGNDRANSYTIFQPGITLSYQKSNMKWFGSIYKGYIAPSKYYGFLVERDGVLVNPLSPEELSNIKPEVSINAELGVRGNLYKNIIGGQIAVYNNEISNFYLAGWNEFFDKLANIRLRGAELALNIDLMPNNHVHSLSIQPSVTLISSKVKSGELVDRHLFTEIKHTQATKQEMVDKANSNPGGYAFYVKNSEGKEELLDYPINVDQIGNVVKTVYKFGKGGIENGETPNTPKFSYSVNADYGYKKFNFGLTYNYVSNQFSEFANFVNESGEGGLGQVKAFSTIDANLNYDFNLSSVRCSFFVVGKNLTNQVVVGSRLNRGQSGIMPTGWRQINSGIILEF